MHTKVVFVLLASMLTTLTVASPWKPSPHHTTTVTVTATAPASTVTTISQCNTGNAQCCNTVGTASSPSVANELGLLGVVLQGINAVVGLGCTPISVIGVGSGVKCNQQPVCCTGTQFNGLINVGCSPISL